MVSAEFSNRRAQGIASLAPKFKEMTAFEIEGNFRHLPSDGRKLRKRARLRQFGISGAPNGPPGNSSERRHSSAPDGDVDRLHAVTPGRGAFTIVADAAAISRRCIRPR
jgi:hypothetical protein